MITDSPVLLVKAVHNFKGTNNDELCLTKGDVITVTQALDGGWWEGTLNGVTGWFPSNYVKELKSDAVKGGETNVQPSEVPLLPNLNDMKMYRGIVFQDIVDTENNHLSELQLLISKYLNPLKLADILNEIEYSNLANNLEDVYACSRALLNMLEDIKGTPSKAQRIGGVFIQIAPLVKKIHSQYCANHPKTVAVIEKHKDILQKFMEEHGANPPGILTLTTGLSRPFRRLEKYPALLQELQRHTQENHIDRGDTQRAASLFRDLAATCASIRRQKEMELEIMSGNIRGWEGEAIHTLGNIVHVGPVTVLTEDKQKRDRHFVMFPETLVILSISTRMSAFVYEGKLPLSGIVIRKLESSEDYQHAFEVSGHMIQRFIVVCSTPDALNQWLNVLQNYKVKCLSPSPNSSFVSLSHPSPSHAAQLKVSPTTNNPLLSQSSRSISPDDKPNNSSRITAAARQVTKKVWPNWNLRPHPPMRASLTTQSEVKLRRSNSCKKERGHESEGDIPIQYLMETFGTYDRARNTTSSATASAPPRLNFEEDKVLIEDMDGDCTEVKEKTLVDTVYMLRDQVQELKLEISSLHKSLNDERQARQKLEVLIKKHILPSQENHIAMNLEG
ncbi:rho guanine nucleotide exchange factor 7-like isoform X2 [Uloborus diversus]|uniref:rho guanine nucleotide exchange factor 7-like isoform X2 n=1 Tax=Uloborus diversus TaxID=327109 RepID=UPI002409D862|nr:rho guanine nucleotide exchange factor 7-like isoform X2 [Uloborus diversus]